MSFQSSRSAPIVSVIMPVYNGERFVREAIESVLQQTLTDLEFIIVDDASSDSTWEILQEYARSDPRLVLLRHDVNQGVAEALNRGLLAAQGEYIARQDADDISRPLRLARQVTFLELHPEIGLVGTAAQLIDIDGMTVGEIIPPTRPNRIRWLLMFGNQMVHTSVMFRKELIEAIGAYCSDKHMAEDYDLWSRFIKVCDLSNLPEPLVSHRRHDRQVSVQAARQQEKSASQVKRAMVEEFLGRPVDRSEIDALNRFDSDTKTVNKASLRRAARVLTLLYQEFSGRILLSKTDSKWLTREVCHHLLLLWRNNLKNHPVETIYLLLTATRISPLSTALEAARLTRLSKWVSANVLV